MNGLKQINDSLGHGAGDAYLKAAAACISEVFSPYGRCFRIGGDEFAVLLKSPHPAAAELAIQLEHACAACSELSEGVQLTISCGFAFAAEHPEEDVTALLKRADAEMYTRKREYYTRMEHDRRKP